MATRTIVVSFRFIMFACIGGCTCAIAGEWLCGDESVVWTCSICAILVPMLLCVRCVCMPDVRNMCSNGTCILRRLLCHMNMDNRALSGCVENTPALHFTPIRRKFTTTTASEAVSCAEVAGPDCYYETNIYHVHFRSYLYRCTRQMSAMRIILLLLPRICGTVLFAELLRTFFCLTERNLWYLNCRHCHALHLVVSSSYKIHNTHCHCARCRSRCSGFVDRPGNSSRRCIARECMMIL